MDIVRLCLCPMPLGATPPPSSSDRPRSILPGSITARCPCLEAYVRSDS